MTGQTERPHQWTWRVRPTAEWMDAKTVCRAERRDAVLLLRRAVRYGLMDSSHLMPIPAILDCDTGHDDAMAILLAAGALDLRGVTTVHGNATVELTTVNACKILELAGLAHIPVAVGAAQSLRRQISHAPGVHGVTGMDGPDLPPPSMQPVAETAVAFIARTAAEVDGLHLVATGPLTNIAAALQGYGEELATRVAGISLMGGSTGMGNATAVAEFNIWADPEAADVVFRSGIPIKMVGLNVTRQVPATPRHRDRIRALGTSTAVAVAALLDFFSEQLQRRYGLSGASMHDPLAVSALDDPAALRFESMQVDIELAGEHTYGMTVCDHRHISTESTGLTRQRDPLGRPNAEVAVAVDPGRFWERFIEVLAIYP